MLNNRKFQKTDHEALFTTQIFIILKLTAFQRYIICWVTSRVNLKSFFFFFAPGLLWRKSRTPLLEKFFSLNYLDNRKPYVKLVYRWIETFIVILFCKSHMVNYWICQLFSLNLELPCLELETGPSLVSYQFYFRN